MKKSYDLLLGIRIGTGVRVKLVRYNFIALF